MIELMIGGIFFALLALATVYRVAKGPNAADRMVAGDSADVLLCCSMVLFSMYTGRGIYLDIALVGALFGIIDTMVVGHYLARRLTK